MSDYKIFIASAGTGSRLKAHTTFRNKALLTLGLKPAICHIIDKFDKNIPIVIAVGYKKDSLMEIVSEFYPDRDIKFVEVDNFEGPGSGLGYSILKCEKLLQCPFIFVPNDTIIPDEKIDLNPCIEGNWVGIKDNTAGYIDPSHYRCAEIYQNTILNILPKGLTTENIYIGLCGVKDYTDFWDAMKSSKESIEDGESFALNALYSKKAIFIEKWHDTGNMNKIQSILDVYAIVDHNILPKKEEAIWINNNKCLKYHNDVNFIKDRIERTNFLPEKNLPKLINIGKNYFSYEYVNGDLLSKFSDATILENLLNGMKADLWNKQPVEFKNSALVQESFYKIKTYERVKAYLRRFDQNDHITVINGVDVESVYSMLDNFDWKSFYSGAIWGRFHGDFHGDNIILEPNGNYKLLDWRQNFGQGNYEFGDIYYDLAKFLHGLMVRHSMVVQNRFYVNHVGATNVDIHIENSVPFIQAQSFFEEWIRKNGFDLNRVKKITALIFLNISGLHHYPYSKFLFLLGQLQLNLCHESK